MVDAQKTSTSLQETTGHLPSKAAMIIHKTKTKTLQNLPSEEATSSPTEGTKKKLPSPGV